MFETAEELLETKVRTCILLQTVKVLDMVQEGKIVDAMSDSPLLDAYEKLVANNILSVPVFSVDKRKYIGFLDMVDIVYHFIETLTDEEISSGFSSFKKKFATVKCGDIVNKSLRDPFKALGKNASVRVRITPKSVSVVYFLIRFRRQ